ncbi:MAG: hypothetical protein JJT75_08770 [Opitutales bacterium]|nr:hypothetical protein [Opitutales bacterium]MCH8539649.1 hypothetical protein [Opitutales bacterium]
MPILRWILISLFLHGSYAAGEDGIFQYAMDLEGEHHRVFLWLPPEAENIEGIVVAGSTSIEKDVVRDPRIRAVCRERNLAIIFGTRGLNGFFHQERLDELADYSGYEELSTTPLFFIGHSAGGPQAKEQAASFGERTFGLMLSRGGIPDAGSRFPTLVLTGQFDEFGGRMRTEEGREPAWEDPRDALQKERSEDPDLLVSLAVEPGAGHFGWSPRNAEMLALFLDKAARGEPTPWVSSLNLREDTSPLPEADFEGDASTQALHLDEELAKAVHRYHADLRAGKKDQFLRWENAHWVDAGVRRFFHNLDFEGDGQHFRVNPTFADRVPKAPNDQGPRWLEAGEKAGHSGGEIRIRIVSGPAEVVDGHLLRLRHDALNPAIGPWGRLTFLAYAEAKGEFRHTELPGMAPRGYRGPQGQSQSITFEPLPDLHKGQDPLPLTATSTSDLPVSFYVARGPAVVREGKLHITGVPARADYPIAIEVVAYQVGSGVEPRFAPAPGVSQTTRLHPPE